MSLYDIYELPLLEVRKAIDAAGNLRGSISNFLNVGLERCIEDYTLRETSLMGYLILIVYSKENQ